MECNPHDFEVTRRPESTISDPLAQVGEVKCKTCGSVFAASQLLIEFLDGKECK